MKTSIALSLLTSSILIAGESDYANRITQLLEDGTTQQLRDIPNVGSDDAPLAIVGESLFRLHTTHNETGASYILDEHVTSGFNPKVNITVVSPDPNVYASGQRYSRVNKPYTVKYTITGIEPTSEVAQARAVILEKERTITGLDNSTNSTTLTKTISTLAPQNETDNANMSNALETKNIYTFFQNLEDPSEAKALESATVRIFPNAEGAVCKDSSFDHFGIPLESFEYFPPVEIAVKNIYPGADVVLRVQAAGKSVDQSDDIILATTGTNDTYSNIFSQTEIAEKLEVAGIVSTTSPVTHTLSLIERSVYGDVVLHQSQFILHSIPINVNANIVGSE